MIQLHNISKWFGDFLLYENLSLYITEGSRIALLAKNGCGKSTLLNIIAGKDSADGGDITFRRDIKIGYLCQNPFFESDATILEAIYHSNPALITTIENYHKAIENNDADKISHYATQMDSYGGWDIEVRAKAILSKLNIFDLTQKVNTLSGGEQRRVALAQVLVDNPDVLILDEPTNHLDLEMSAWLEEYLLKCGKTLFMVTHDRYFLDRVCTDIYEIDQKELFSYKGGYSDYVEKRAIRIEQFETEKERAQNLYRTELDWMRRMPQARGTKAKYRKDAFYEIKDKAFATRSDSKVRINVGEARLGTKIFEAKDLYKSFGEKCVLRNFTYTFNRGEKLGIIGKNGSGKSTLLKLLTAQISPDSGVVDLGSSVKFGYYKQEGINFDDNTKVIDVVRDIAEVVTLGDGSTVGVSQFLTQFMFEPAVQHSFVAKLSGGERRRLYLLTILMRSPNFLILDEPTNDLDIATLNVLESYLENFGGCLIVVSHDRFFMDKVVDHLLVFEDDGVTKLFEGNYTQYRNAKEEEEELKAALKPQNSASTAPRHEPKERQKKLSYKEKQEYEALEKDIESLEAEKSEIESKLASGECSNDELIALTTRHGAVSEELDEKEMRWLELEEIKSGN
ncbi:MAG: ABC-F family ATP-binding cassette domain-containing protein [Rikenellaceae bacterium]